MLTVGIDFGSTYTIASVYRSDTQKLEPVILGTGTPYIPSIVACDGEDLRGELLYGQEAKQSTDEDDYHIYKAFKMLLAETDEEVLKKRGFSGKADPVSVAGVFLRNLVKKICSHCGERKIDQLVIGAPEIWFKGVNTFSGRSILKEICSGIDEIGSVLVVSEPAAACAFFAYNYKQIVEKPYEGNILLIDYGGGTLDISLTEVSSHSEEDGRQTMEIKVVEQNGAGECQDGEIGKAGIIYMESVIREAIRRAGLVEEGAEIPNDNDFYQTVDKLELKLQEGKNKIDDHFEDYGITDLEDLEDRFAMLKYKGSRIEVTYALLVEIYNQVIRDIFQEKLDEMKLFMKKHGIDYMSISNENFKIALVGGFGNFYLVNRQVEDTFSFSSQDIRRKDIIINKTDCENAISLGTALLAAGVIGIRQTAPYSIGILQFDMAGKCVIDYAIRYKQDILPDEIYYHLDMDGNPSRFFIAEGRIDNVVINSEHDDRFAMVLPFKKEFRQKLSNLVPRKLPIAAIGFSLDASEILTIWVQEYSAEQGRKEAKSIALGRFDEMFVTSKITKVTDLI